MKNSNIKVFNCENCLFKQTVCQYITSEEFNFLYQNTQQLRFRRNEYILKQGARSDYIIYLAKGRIKINFESETNRNVILTISNSPMLIGSVLLLNNEINLFSIIAIEDCDVCLINTNILKSFILANGQLSLKLLEIISNMFKDTIINFISLAQKQVMGRIADVLLFLSNTLYKNTYFTLSLTRKEIAEFAGCSQENVINTLSKLNKDGIIILKGKSIEIIDLEKLNKISLLG